MINKKTPKSPKNNNKRKDNIYMPYKQVNKKPVKRKKNIITKIKGKNNSKRRKRPTNPKIFVLILFGIITIALLFLSIKFILNMRNTDDTYEETYVVGLQDIPAYPGSEFIFEENMNMSSISNFVSQGNSAYRLSPGTDIDDVYAFYIEKLPEKGWSQVLSVPVGSEEQKSGEYWAKEGVGLRLYYKFNDIWYETITIEEAQTGLSAQVQEEVERELLLASDDYQDLLPDYPWKLAIPKQYLITYTSSNIEDYRSVSFQEIGGEEIVKIVPVGYVGEKVLDYFLDDYISTLDDTTAGVINTIYLNASRIRGTLSVEGKLHTAAVLSNSYNGVVYVFESNQDSSEFFEYILENITTQDSLIY